MNSKSQPTEREHSRFGPSSLNARQICNAWSGEDEDEDLPQHMVAPETWADVPTRYEFLCPSPLFALKESHRVELSGNTFEIDGSTMRLTNRRLGDSVRIGVLGAIKDASAGTRKNLRRAKRAFAKAKVDFISLN